MARPSSGPGAGEYTSGIRSRGEGWRALVQSAGKSASAGTRACWSGGAGGVHEGASGLRILAETPSWVVSHETHLSAEKAQARANSRISDADADAGRAHDPQASPCQGPQATDGLMRPAPGGSAAVRSRPAVQERRLRPCVPQRPVACRTRVRALCVPARGGRPSAVGPVGIPQGGWGGGAQPSQAPGPRGVHPGSERLPAGVDVVVVARRDAQALAEGEGLRGVQSALAELIARAGGSPREDPQDRSVVPREEGATTA